MSGNIGTPRTRFNSRLPTAQLNAPESARARASAGRSAPTVSPTSTSPAAARIMPKPWRAVGRSPNSKVASSTVRKTWVCCVTEARPGGIPCRKARNKSRNWPANKLSPISTSKCQGMAGRATKRTGIEAIRKRSAVSWGAVKPSKPNRIATNASPQITDTKAARAMSRGVMGHFSRTPRPRSTDCFWRFERVFLF